MTFKESFDIVQAVYNKLPDSSRLAYSIRVAAILQEELSKNASLRTFFEGSGVLNQSGGGLDIDFSKVVSQPEKMNTVILSAIAERDIKALKRDF